MDLLQQNVAIYRDIIPDILRYALNALILVVTNPIDISYGDAGDKEILEK